MATLPLRDPTSPATQTLAHALAAAGAEELALSERAGAEAAELALTALSHPELRRLLDGADTAMREAPFAVPLNRLPGIAADAAGLLEGSIDLLLLGPGRTIVLDYKTDRAGPARRRELEDRYWPQLALYALAVQACYGGEGDVEMVLFFVRDGTLVRRGLDTGLLTGVSREVARQLTRGAGGARAGRREPVENG